MARAKTKSKMPAASKAAPKVDKSPRSKAKASVTKKRLAKAPAMPKMSGTPSGGTGGPLGGAGGLMGGMGGAGSF